MLIPIYSQINSIYVFVIGFDAYVAWRHLKWRWYMKHQNNWYDEKHKVDVHQISIKQKEKKNYSLKLG